MGGSWNRAARAPPRGNAPSSLPRLPPPFTLQGQSGSPFWDGRNMVRGVHVRGMPTINEFSNVNGQTLKSILTP